MTTALGKPLVVKVLSAPCSGDCGGTIRVTTDLFDVYAEIVDTDCDFVGGETDVVDFEVDERRILVNCPSLHNRPHSSCWGSATFDVDAFEWVDAAAVADTAHMKRMHRA